MNRYTQLSYISIVTTTANRLSYLKTGKAVVISGSAQHLPTMKGTRSGF